MLAVVPSEIQAQWNRSEPSIIDNMTCSSVAIIGISKSCKAKVARFCVHRLSIKFCARDLTPGCMHRFIAIYCGHYCGVASICWPDRQDSGRVCEHHMSVKSFVPREQSVVPCQPMRTENPKHLPILETCCLTQAHLRLPDSPSAFAQVCSVRQLSLTLSQPLWQPAEPFSPPSPLPPLLF